MDIQPYILLANVEVRRCVLIFKHKIDVFGGLAVTDVSTFVIYFYLTVRT